MEIKTGHNEERECNLGWKKYKQLVIYLKASGWFWIRSFKHFYFEHASDSVWRIWFLKTRFSQLLWHFCLYIIVILILPNKNNNLTRFLDLLPLNKKQKQWELEPTVEKGDTNSRKKNRGEENSRRSFHGKLKENGEEGQYVKGPLLVKFTGYNRYPYNWDYSRLIRIWD